MDPAASSESSSPSDDSSVDVLQNELSSVGIDILTSCSRSPLSTGGTCTVEVSSTITSVAVVDDSGAFLDRLVGLFEGLALRFSGTFLFFFSTGPFDGSGAFEVEASFVV
nr:hypothetical protein Iba_chr12aCG10410 [Ipomoea batatas]